MRLWKKKETSAERGQPRRRVVPWWRARLTMVVAALLVLAGGGGGGWWAWQAGHVDRARSVVKWELIAASARLGLTVQDILVLGRRETPRDDLLRAVRLARGAPILAFDPETARQRVESLPWVQSAIVERRLPDTVLLSLVERQPLALWQHKGRFALIDHQGVVIEDDGMERFPGLLVVVGEDAPAHAAALQAVLVTQPELMARVKAAVRVGGRRWNLHLDNDIDVRLPEENPAGAWARLAEYERSHRVLARDVQILDLRLPDRLIVRKRQRPAKAGGRET
jgi:cell division protein FtsQ